MTETIGRWWDLLVRVFETSPAWLPAALLTWAITVGVTQFVRNYVLRGNQVAFLYYGPLAVGKRAYVVIASANGNKVRLLKLNKTD